MFYAKNGFVIWIARDSWSTPSFKSDVKRVLKWIESINIEQHRATRVLSIRIGHLWDHDEDYEDLTFKDRLPYLKRLGDALKKQGYEQP